MNVLITEFIWIETGKHFLTRMIYWI